jgi:hypothetical protein
MLCMQWGSAMPAVLEVSHDLLMLVDGETQEIIVGNPNVSRLEVILGQGIREIGRKILQDHVVMQLRTLGPGMCTASNDTTITGIDGSVRHMKCTMSAYNQSKVVMAMQDNTVLFNKLRANHNTMKVHTQIMLDLMKSQSGTKAFSEVAAVMGMGGMGGMVANLSQPEAHQHMRKPTAMHENPPQDFIMTSAGDEVKDDPAAKIHPSPMPMVMAQNPPMLAAENEPQMIAFGPADFAPAHALCPRADFTMDDFENAAMLQELATENAVLEQHADPDDEQSGKSGRGTSKPRRPYRFCSRCWLLKHEWVIRSVTLPTGRSICLADHKHDTCPLWPKGTSPTPEQNRAYAAAFKFSQRRFELHTIAMNAFKELMPDMSDADIEAFVRR